MMIKRWDLNERFSDKDIGITEYVKKRRKGQLSPFLPLIENFMYLKVSEEQSSRGGLISEYLLY